MYDANIFLAYNIKILKKFERNSEMYICNHLCSMYVIYYIYVNQMLVYNKSSNGT